MASWCPHCGRPKGEPDHVKSMGRWWCDLQLVAESPSTGKLHVPESAQRNDQTKARYAARSRFKPAEPAG